MRPANILALRVFHAIVFFFMVGCLAYLIYCAIAIRYDWTLLIALIAILIEGLALLLNRFRCPLTSLAERYGAASGQVTDMFLPAWLARHSFKVAAVIVIIALIWLAWGYFG